MNIWHDKYGTRHVDSDAAPRWAPPDKTVYLHSAHVAEYRNYSADASHRWAEEHGEDINEPFAELTEMIE